ncbi:MAG: SDR family NAD(P)-dependent oxidoreductase [Cyclobacteriaceae bacterium]
MGLNNQCVLITGGSSGIGLELSRQLIARKNKVLICGRSMKKLQEAKAELLDLHIFQCDLSVPTQCDKLIAWITDKHQDLNMLINNAAIVHKESFMESTDSCQKAELELQVNFLAPIRLIKGLLPTLQSNQDPVIVNVTTGLIYAPRADYPFYNSTKAALHSFTQVLRRQANGSGVRIIEIMFPAVKTPWHKGAPPKIAITAEQAVREMLSGLKKKQLEVRIGGVKLLYWLSRIAPRFTINRVNSLQNDKQKTY